MPTPECQKRWKRKYRSTPIGRAAIAWNSILHRLKHQKAYADVRLCMTRAEFMTWAIPAYKHWMTKHPGKVPTLDRIVAGKGYRLGNLTISTKADNSSRTLRNKNGSAPSGKAWCSGCRKYKPKRLFSKRSKSKYGVSTHCKPCASTYHKNWRARNG